MKQMYSVRLLQARTEALTRLDQGLDALAALRREYLARLAEEAQPGSVIVIRRDAADTEWAAYEYYLAVVKSPFQPLPRDMDDDWGVRFKEGTIALQAAYLWMAGAPEMLLDDFQGL